MGTVAEKLAAQVGIIQAAIKRPFSDYPEENKRIIDELCAYLIANGTTDVRDLRHYENADANLEFFFDVKSASVYRTFGLDYAGPDGVAVGYGLTGPRGENYQHNLLIMFDGRFDQFYVHCVFTPEGFPIFFALRIKHHNDWAETFRAVAGLAGIAISLAVPALAATLGQAILGAEVAAAYPAIANGIGQVAISTALNGGDVQSAVVSAVSGGIGGGVGGMVASASDSAILGSVAASVTKTAIVGGNIEQAALQSLASSGIQSATQLPVFSGEQTVAKLGDSWGTEPDLDTYWMPADVAPIYDIPVYTDTPDLGPGYGGFDYASQGYHDPVWSVNGSAEGATVLAPGATTPPAGPSGIVTSVGGANLTQLALTAIKAVTSWNAAGQPSIRTSNATVRANPNGTLTQSNGVATRMPTGTPYLTSDNSLVTNNGDGTFTTVSANGGITTQAYGASVGGFGFGKSISIGGLQISPVVLGVAAVGTVLLLRK